MSLAIGVGLGVTLTSGSGEQAFSPADVAGLKLWLDASLGVTLNASTVSAWADQSGNGDANRNALQASAILQPTYNASNASYNGKPTIDFADPTLLKTGIWSAELTQPNTIFVAGNQNGAVTFAYMFDALGPEASLFNVANGLAVQAYAGTGLNLITTVVNTSTIACVTYNGASSSIRVRTKTAGTTGNTGANTFTGMTVGNYNGGGNFSLKGPIAEVLAYSGALSGANVSLILDYLGAKYNIAIGA